VITEIMIQVVGHLAEVAARRRASIARLTAPATVIAESVSTTPKRKIFLRSPVTRSLVSAECR
jgi:hypothetical protein